MQDFESNVDDYKCSYTGDMTLKINKGHCSYSSYLRKYHISS